MRAMALTEFGGPDRLAPADLPRPKPRRGEILVRVVSCGVNPVDWKLAEGLLSTAWPHAFPLVPGWDAAGVVDELGEGSGRFRKGDRVYCLARKPVAQWGAYAEYLAVDEAAAALMPVNLLFEEAAAVPLAALTAWQALFTKAGLAAGQTVLVHGASGGVGHFAVQLAANAGARVAGTAGTANQEFVASLGAELAVDHTRDGIAESVRRRFAEGVDVVLDAVGGDDSDLLLDALRPGGILVSITGPRLEAPARSRGFRFESFLVEPSAEQLRRIALLAERKRLKPHLSKIRPLARAAEAWAESKAGHVRGKLVLNL